MTWGWPGRRDGVTNLPQISGALYKSVARCTRVGHDGDGGVAGMAAPSFTSPEHAPNLYPEGFQGNFIPVDALPSVLMSVPAH
ncbi:hypothetical protein C8R47DRAFT_1231009 [Mycena vitilis]|nr:hypothetical protein C8R47DRAFT_1231009 [Mycena vitilis]